MIRLAFEEIGKGDVLVELSEVHMDVSGSALGHAVSIWVSDDNEQRTAQRYWLAHQ